MMKAANLIGLAPSANLEFKTFEDFSFAPITADIQKVLLLVKRQTLWKATQHKRSDMAELPGVNLDHRINKQLERMNPLRRAAVDQTLFGTVTTQAELAKQHKVTKLPLPPQQRLSSIGTGTAPSGPLSERTVPNSLPPYPD